VARPALAGDRGGEKHNWGGDRQFLDQATDAPLGQVFSDFQAYGEIVVFGDSQTPAEIGRGNESCSIRSFDEST
jgi:hypothetical protein